MGRRLGARCHAYTVLPLGSHIVHPHLDRKEITETIQDGEKALDEWQIAAQAYFTSAESYGRLSGATQDRASRLGVSEAESCARRSWRLGREGQYPAALGYAEGESWDSSMSRPVDGGDRAHLRSMHRAYLEGDCPIGNMDKASG